MRLSEVSARNEEWVLGGADGPLFNFPSSVAALKNHASPRAGSPLPNSVLRLRRGTVLPLVVSQIAFLKLGEHRDWNRGDNRDWNRG